MAWELQFGPHVLLALKADQKYPQGQLSKCSVFSSGARVLQSACYKSSGKCDSVVKCLNWSSSFLEVAFSLSHTLLRFQIIILEAWIFIRKLLSSYWGFLFCMGGLFLRPPTLEKKNSNPHSI